jgi:hypothetical protein
VRAAAVCAGRINSKIIVSIVSTVSGRENKGHNEPKHRPSMSSGATRLGSDRSKMAERFNSFMCGSALTVLTMLTMLSRSRQSLVQIPPFSRYGLAG